MSQRLKTISRKDAKTFQYKARCTVSKCLGNGVSQRWGIGQGNFMRGYEFTEKNTLTGEGVEEANLLGPPWLQVIIDADDVF